LKLKKQDKPEIVEINSLANQEIKKHNLSTFENYFNSVVNDDLFTEAKINILREKLKQNICTSMEFVEIHQFNYTTHRYNNYLMKNLKLDNFDQAQVLLNSRTTRKRKGDSIININSNMNNKSYSCKTIKLSVKNPIEKMKKISEFKDKPIFKMTNPKNVYGNNRRAYQKDCLLKKK